MVNINCFMEYLDRNPTDPELDVREIVDMNEFLNVIKSIHLLVPGAKK